jgi:hypothetical protein
MKTKGFLITAFSGMVALVIWGMIFWGFLADPAGVFHKLPDEKAITKALVDSNTPTGTYFMPWPRNTPETFKAFVEQHKTGPFYKLSFVREGVNPDSPGKIAIGCLHYFTVSAMATYLIILLGPASFRKRFTLIFLAGLLGSNFITIGDPIWFHMPWDYVKGVLIYEIISWLLLALIIAFVSDKQLIEK